MFCSLKDTLLSDPFLTVVKLCQALVQPVVALASVKETTVSSVFSTIRKVKSDASKAPLPPLVLNTASLKVTCIGVLSSSSSVVTLVTYGNSLSLNVLMFR